VAIGVWALTVVLSVMSGFEGDLKAKILGTRAHGVVSRRATSCSFPQGSLFESGRFRQAGYRA